MCSGGEANARNAEETRVRLGRLFEEQEKRFLGFECVLTDNRAGFAVCQLRAPPAPTSHKLALFLPHSMGKSG